MKTVLVCALLALVPFTSLRMVCVDAHGAGAAATAAVNSDAAETGATEAEDECARICARRPSPHAEAPAPAAPSVTCLLVADPTCQFLSTATAAIMPRQPGLPVQRRAVRLDPPAARGYVVPLLDRRSPPPRAHA
jgi:hypothetical protein